MGDHSTGAGNEIRTRDTKLGKLVLYQLSYARSDKMVKYYKNMFLSIKLMISINFNDFIKTMNLTVTIHGELPLFKVWKPLFACYSEGATISSLMVRQKIFST
jgi:hypothetical protein